MSGTGKFYEERESSVGIGGEERTQDTLCLPALPLHPTSGYNLQKLMLSLNLHKNRTQKSSLLYSLARLLYLTASGFRRCCGFYFEEGFDSVDEFIKKQTSLYKNSKSELLLKKKKSIVLTVFGPHAAWQPLSGAE